MTPERFVGRRHYVDTPSGQMHLHESGRGETLVLLTPAPRSWRVYRALLPHLGGFRCLAIDTPGFGGSDPLDGPPSMSAYAASVAACLQAMGVERSHVFGLHTGNKIGAALAAEHPGRVDRFVCVGMTHSILLNQDRRNAAMRGVVTKPLETGPAPEHLSRWIDSFRAISGMWWDPRIASGAATAAELDLVRDEVADMLDAPGYDHCYAANFAFDLQAALEAVAAPTLIVELVARHEHHLGAAGPEIIATMADARLETLEGTDRELLRRHPERLARPIQDFLTAPVHVTSSLPPESTQL